MIRKRYAISISALLLAVLLIITTIAVAQIFNYVGSSKSNKYHYPDCMWAQKIKTSNLVVFSNAQEARDAGYVPCKVCNPPWND